MGSHLVSAAEKEQNQVGMPSCLIMANTALLACFQYGGEPLIVAKHDNHHLAWSANQQNQKTEFHQQCTDVHFLHFLIASVTLSLICLICSLLSL